MPFKKLHVLGIYFLAGRICRSVVAIPTASQLHLSWCAHIASQHSKQHLHSTRTYVPMCHAILLLCLEYFFCSWLLQTSAVCIISDKKVTTSVSTSIQQLRLTIHTYYAYRHIIITQLSCQLWRWRRRRRRRRVGFFFISSFLTDKILPPSHSVSQLRQVCMIIQGLSHLRHVIYPVQQYTSPPVGPAMYQVAMRERPDQREDSDQTTFYPPPFSGPLFLSLLGV